LVMFDFFRPTKFLNTGASMPMTPKRSPQTQSSN
jgi:hypothetical protein